jgi:hypothetical protein
MQVEIFLDCVQNLDKIDSENTCTCTIRKWCPMVCYMLSLACWSATTVCFYYGVSATQ